MTTYSHQLVTDDHTYDYIVAHELAHHWWGDYVTLGDWREIWLNEGFAVYSEALYFESLGGQEQLGQYMENLAEVYYREVARYGHFSIYDPAYMWGGTIYQKGAWVLHMLRWVIGEESFWRTLRAWAKSYPYDNALISDFIQIAENESGQEMDWFFEQWLYQPGYPDLNIWWRSQQTDDGLYSATVTVEQQQWESFSFTIPLEIAFTTRDGTVLDTLISEQHQTEYQFVLQNKPLSLEIDPNHWVLKKADVVSEPLPPGVLPNEFYLADNYPNPFQAGNSTLIGYHVPQLFSPHPITLKLFNVLGREIIALVDHAQHGGYYTISWDGRDVYGQSVAPGVYIVRLISQETILEKKITVFSK